MGSSKLFNDALAIEVLRERGHDSYDFYSKKIILTALERVQEASERVAVHFLLERGLDLIKKDEGEYILLWFASKFGHVNVVQRLLERGINVNNCTHYGNSFIHPAVEGGHEAVVRLLLDHGISVDTKYDIQECTALNLASRSENLEVIRLLIDRGADINHKDSRECTPIMLAVINNHDRVVELLFDRGADPHVKAKNSIWKDDRSRLCEEKEGEIPLQLK